MYTYKYARVYVCVCVRAHLMLKIFALFIIVHFLTAFGLSPCVIHLYFEYVWDKYIQLKLNEN